MIPERDDDHDGDDVGDDDDGDDDDDDDDKVAWVCRERQVLAAGNQEHTDLAHRYAIFLGSLDDNLAGNQEDTDQLQTALYSSGRGNPHSWS